MEGKLEFKYGEYKDFDIFFAPGPKEFRARRKKHGTMSRDIIGPMENYKELLHEIDDFPNKQAAEFDRIIKLNGLRS